MKTSTIRLISLLFAAIPMMAAARTNVKSAFDAIIKCPEAQITESHTLDKDPATNVKTGQSDVYRFALPANKSVLVKNVFSAFDKDADMAYSLNRGKAISSDLKIHLAVGDAGTGGVIINEPGCEYVYALYLASSSEDPEGIHRYAYGMNFKEEDDGKLVGKLIVTYATTLKYRQDAEKQRQYDFIHKFSKDANVISSSDLSQNSWLDILMSCFQSMTSANSQTRIALATKAYKVIRDTSKYSEVTISDKEVVREILKGMISEKKYSETVLNNLLNQCLVILK